MTSMSNVPLCACIAVGETRVADAETLREGPPAHSDTADPGATTPAFIFPEVEARLVDPEVDMTPFDSVFETMPADLIVGTTNLDPEVEMTPFDPEVETETAGLVFGTSSRDTEVEITLVVPEIETMLFDLEVETMLIGSVVETTSVNAADEPTPIDREVEATLCVNGTTPTRRRAVFVRISNSTAMIP